MIDLNAQTAISSERGCNILIIRKIRVYRAIIQNPVFGISSLDQKYRNIVKHKQEDQWSCKRSPNLDSFICKGANDPGLWRLACLDPRGMGGRI